MEDSKKTVTFEHSASAHKLSLSDLLNSRKNKRPKKLVKRGAKKGKKNTV